MADYNLESLYTGKVIMNGYPRNSIFMNKEKAEEVREKLGNELLLIKYFDVASTFVYLKVLISTSFTFNPIELINS